MQKTRAVATERALKEVVGRDTSDPATNLANFQVNWVSRRCIIDASRARLIAHLAFGFEQREVSQ